MENVHVRQHSHTIADISMNSSMISKSFRDPILYEAIKNEKNKIHKLHTRFAANLYTWEVLV